MENSVLDKFKELPDESVLFKLSPEEVATIFFLLGIALAEPLAVDELNVIANGLFLTAQVMFMISAQRAFINAVVAQINDQIEKEEAEIKEKKEKKEAEQKEKQDAKEKQEDKKVVESLESKIKKLQEQVQNLQKLIENSGIK